MQNLTTHSPVAQRVATPWLARTAVAGAIGAGLLVLASSAAAAIIHSGPVNLAIPVSINGLYLNVVTGADNLPAGTGGTTVPGWDINLWSSTGLGFFNPVAPTGGAYVVTAPGFAANLAPGAMIDGSSTFGSGNTANIAQWALNSTDNLFGFRFVDEGNANSLHYGWGRILLGATIVDPSRRLVEYAYESTPGAGIQAGAVPVGMLPVPGTLALVGASVAGLLLTRRRQAQ